MDRGYIGDALESTERELTRTSEGSIWYWRFRLIKAEALIRRGNATDGRALLVLEPSPSLPPDVLARRKILDAQSLCQLKNFSEARISLEEAIAAAHGQRGLLAEVYLIQGRCESLQNQWDEAQKDLKLALELSGKSNGFLQASAMGNLGVLLMQTERYDEAIQEFQQVLDAAGSLQSPLLEQITLGNLGFCYAQLGDWTKALSFSERAERIANEIKNKGAQERWLIDVGKAHFALWELPEAEVSYIRALGLSEQLQDRANTALCYHNLALLALRENDVAKADAYRQKGEALNVAREVLHFEFDKAEIALAQKQSSSAERIFKKLLPQTAGDAVVHSMVQRDLGKVFWQEKKFNLADLSFREGIRTAENALAQLKRPEYRMSFMDRDPFYDSYIQFLVAQNKPVEALRIAERSRAQVLSVALGNQKTGLPSISVAALEALARGRNCVILSYSLTDEKSFSWVITSSRFKVLELPSHYTIGSQILAFNREIQQHTDIGASPAAAKLYEMLVGRAEEFIPHGSRVVIIPSKALSVVNFEALIAPKPQPHYWIENVDVEVASSLALLARTQTGKRSPATRELLALGAPVEATNDFPVLKHAPEEMQRVRSHFSPDQSTFISGTDAVPRAYFTSNPGQYRFLHLDTHGVSSDMNPLESAIILSPAPDGTYKLSAQEIKDIPLHADLVTISACYGAGTRWYQGEGIVGLAWAFLRAGAHQVVAALWEVDDASTPQLMDDFYGELTQGKSAAEALRDAKLKMLHSSDFHRHPYYWATLQLYTGS
ncbi:MAG TPA: CHAT domain-containing tetratricopeptide repeat protein [Candidatus Angelobacter sp.]|nr:CHAT domain-containing tetratricopeptide repeat protein [Candidatus Angelobacter sp.]